MAQPGDGPTNRRRFVRVPLRARVALSSPTVRDLIDGPLHDISEGGLFIKTKARRPIGTKISIRIVVPADDVTMELNGEIVRAVSVDESRRGGHPAGLAVMFTDLDQPTKEALGRLVEAAVRARGEAP
jgi:Tfp pilus assembly protein PilZ